SPGSFLPALPRSIMHPKFQMSPHRTRGSILVRLDLWRSIPHIHCLAPAEQCCGVPLLPLSEPPSNPRCTSNTPDHFRSPLPPTSSPLAGQLLPCPHPHPCRLTLPHSLSFAPSFSPASVVCRFPHPPL